LHFRRKSLSESKVQESVNRCVQAFHRQRGDHDLACQSFLAELPILSGPAGVHAYLACIGKALALGVIDLLDIGRYCHVAQLAMRAWKLSQDTPGLSHSQTREGCRTARPSPTKGNHSESEKRSDVPAPSRLGTREGCDGPENPHPLPTNSNHLEEESNQIATPPLPDFETQKAIYKSLRQQGLSLPSNSHLLKNPIEAMIYCNMAGAFIGQQPLTDGPDPRS